MKLTSEIKNFAIFSVESKGSNVYRIEACTNKKIETTLQKVVFFDKIIKEKGWLK